MFLEEFNTRNTIVLKGILRWFELASGLKANFHRSMIRAVVVEEVEVQRHMCYYSELSNHEFFFYVS